MRLRVFDRWGNFLFQSLDQSQRWDGTFKGEDVDPGVYTWVLEIEGYRPDGTMYAEVLSGSITLIR